jgi:hypothetical protein
VKIVASVSRGMLAVCLPITSSCIAQPTTPPDFSTTQPPWSGPISQDTDAAAEESGGGGVGATTGVNSGGATAQTSTPDAGTWHQQPATASQDAGSWAKDAAAAMTTWPTPASDASGTMPTMPAGDSGSSSSLYPPTTMTAQDFCNLYQMYCGFGTSQRDADMNACIMRYNSNSGQDGCYVYHLQAAIAGTATLCTTPPTQMCFDLHCPHATGLGGYCS